MPEAYRPRESPFFGRVARAGEIDDAIAAWTAPRSIDEILEAMNKARVPAGRIHSARDIAEDEHHAARDMIRQTVTSDGLRLKGPGVVPKLSETPGTLRTRAPRPGEHTEAVLQRPGYPAEEIATLRAEQVIRGQGQRETYCVTGRERTWCRELHGEWSCSSASSRPGSAPRPRIRKRPST